MCGCRGMLHRAVAAGMPFGYVAGDEVYGRSANLRAAVEQAGYGYVLEVGCDFRVHRHPADTIRVDHAVADVPAWGWKHRSQGPGRKAAHPCLGLDWLGPGRLPRRLGTQPADPPRPRPDLATPSTPTSCATTGRGPPWRVDRGCRAPVGHRGVFRDRQVRGRARRAPGPPLDRLVPPRDLVHARRGVPRDRLCGSGSARRAVTPGRVRPPRLRAARRRPAIGPRVWQLAVTSWPGMGMSTACARDGDANAGGCPG